MNTQEAARNENMLQEANIQLDAEALRLRKTTKEVRDGFAKTRDLLRVEQVALEGARSEIAVLREQLKICDDEAIRARNLESAMSEMHKNKFVSCALGKCST